MNEKYEVNLVDSDKSSIKNSKKEEYNIINLNAIKESIITIINNNLPEANKKVNKILLIGDNSKYIYDQLNQNFSNVQFLIANTLASRLNSFNDNNISEKNYLVHLIDIFDGRSLFNFTMKFKKFDLIIISNLYNRIENKEKKKKIRNSARFIYKHLLKKNGLLCIIPSIRDLESNRVSFLKNLKVPLVNNLEIKMFKSPLNLTLYIKK